jgi:hypothetical protein
MEQMSSDLVHPADTGGGNCGSEQSSIDLDVLYSSYLAYGSFWKSLVMHSGAAMEQIDLLGSEFHIDSLISSSTRCPCKVEEAGP